MVMVSIIVSVHNMEAYLDACVESILQQTYADFELILINDGSVDKSGSMCMAYAQKDARVRVLHNEKSLGISAVRNQGVRAARGAYVMQIDADDYVDITLVEKLLALCQRFHVPLAGCNHYIVRSGQPVPCFPAEGEDRVLSAREACENVLYHDVPDVSVWGKLMQRQLAEQICYPEGRVYEDTYRIAELLLAAGGMAYTPKPLYSYRIRPNSISRGRLDESKKTYIDAVKHMNEVILQQYPELAFGALRRETHALLSVRRYYMFCGKACREERNALEKQALQNARAVMQNPRTPRRDKLALLALKCGSLAYDVLFSLYARVRG